MGQATLSSPLNLDDKIDPESSAHSNPDEGQISSGRCLFDFRKFLGGGALDDVFGVSPDSTTTPNPTSDGDKWEVTKLSGGVINLTLRVTNRYEDDKSERNPKSVVIKYAPPFIVGLGEDAPFGTFRQVIEHRALSLLGSTPSITTAKVVYRVSIPRVLKFSEDESVLVLEDLGKWMKPLALWVCPSTASTAEPPPSSEMCASVGTRLGGFLASVHCDPTLLSKSQTLTADGKPWFENTEADEAVRTGIVGRILPILQAHFGSEMNGKEKIAEIISQDFEQSFLNARHPSPSSTPSGGVTKSMFSVGDLWVGSFLVGSPPISDLRSNPNFDANTRVELGFIDWEFASPAGTGRDMAQLTASLYLYSTSSTWSHLYRMATDAITSSFTPRAVALDFETCPWISEGGARTAVDEGLGGQSAIRTLRRALLRAYAHKVKEYPDHAWFVDEGCRFGKERLAVIRCIWVAFGREVIFNAIDLKFKFVEFFATNAGGDEEMKAWQREMVEVGCWYASMAGQKPDREFEEIVRKEGVLREIYTTSESSQ